MVLGLKNFMIDTTISLILVMGGLYMLLFSFINYI
jgi:hypothetical protein